MKNKYLIYILLMMFPFSLLSQIRVSEIRFEGNESYSASDLLEIIKNESGMVFKTYIANSDRISIQNFYISEGFIDAEISFREEVEDDRFSEKILVFTIRENFRHHFGEIAVRGNKTVVFEDIWNLFDGKMGEVYKPSFLTDWKNRIIRMYQEKGKPAVNVQISTSIDTRQNFQVNLFVEIEEDKTFYIGNIYYTSINNDSLVTNPKIITNELEFSSGDKYDVKSFENSYKYLYKTGLFQTVELKSIPRNSIINSDVDTLDVFVNLQEKKGNYLGAAAGITYNLGGTGAEVFGTIEDDWLINLETEFGKRNIWEGSGADIRLEANPELLYLKEKSEFAINKIDLSFQLSKINFPLHRVKSTASVNYLKYTPQSNDTFNQIGYSLTSLYEFSERENIRFTFDYEKNEGTGNDTTLKQLGLTETDIVSMSSSYLLDKRSHYVSPDEGYLFGISGKVSRSTPKVQSETFKNTVFYTARMKFSKYIPLKKNRKYVFAWNLNMSAIFTQDTISYIPKTERLYIKEQLRGHDVDGPGKWYKPDGASTDIPFGGKYLFATNFELRTRLYKDWYGQTFVDAGAIWTESSDISLSSLRYSYGGGISWNLDYFVIRLEYGFKLNRKNINFINDPDRKEREDIGKFHLGASYFF